MRSGAMEMRRSAAVCGASIYCYLSAADQNGVNEAFPARDGD